MLRGYGVGAVDYLSKPVNAEILRSKVGVFVDAFRKTRALAELNDALQREVAEREQAQEALQLGEPGARAARAGAHGGADPRASGRARERRAAAHGAGGRADRRLGVAPRVRPDDAGRPIRRCCSGFPKGSFGHGTADRAAPCTRTTRRAWSRRPRRRSTTGVVRGRISRGPARRRRRLDHRARTGVRGRRRRPDGRHQPRRDRRARVGAGARAAAEERAARRATRPSGRAG